MSQGKKIKKKGLAGRELWGNEINVFHGSSGFECFSSVMFGRTEYLMATKAQLDKLVSKRQTEMLDQLSSLLGYKDGFLKRVLKEHGVSKKT